MDVEYFNRATLEFFQINSKNKSKDKCFEEISAILKKMKKLALDHQPNKVIIVR
jgi:hypothetical protein